MAYYALESIHTSGLSMYVILETRGRSKIKPSTIIVKPGITITETERNEGNLCGHESQ